MAGRWQSEPATKAWGKSSMLDTVGLVCTVETFTVYQEALNALESRQQTHEILTIFLEENLFFMEIIPTFYDANYSQTFNNTYCPSE